MYIEQLVLLQIMVIWLFIRKLTKEHMNLSSTSSKGGERGIQISMKKKKKKKKKIQIMLHDLCLDVSYLISVRQ